MIFEVDVVTTMVKRVKVNASDLSHARMIAKDLDARGCFTDVKYEPNRKAFKAYCRCSRCNKRTQLYYTSDAESYCLSCFREMTAGWRDEQRMIV